MATDIIRKETKSGVYVFVLF